MSFWMRVSVVAAKAIRQGFAVSGLSVVMDQESNTCASCREGFMSGARAEDVWFSLLGLQVWSCLWVSRMLRNLKKH